MESKKLLDENIINPSDTSRKVEGLIFEASTDPAITGLTVDAQFTGDNLYDAIKKTVRFQKCRFPNQAVR